MVDARKILIIRPDRLGDLILSLPVAEILKEKIQPIEVHYLASSYTADLAPMIDYVDSWLRDDNGHGRRLPLIRLAGKIKAADFDCLIELKPSWRTAAAGLLAGTKTRIGTSRRAYSIYYNRRINIHRKSSGVHQTDLELGHLSPFGINTSGILPRLTATETGKMNAAKLLGSGVGRYVVIHPGSSGSAPNWPLENYRKLAEMLLLKTNYKVVITDRDESKDEFSGCLDLGGRTDFETLAGVISGAALFISGSTGPMHMADALDIACVSFFSNRSDLGPSRWGPRRNMDNVLITNKKCGCGNAAACRCLERITVEKAFDRIDSLLSVDKELRVKSDESG